MIIPPGRSLTLLPPTSTPTRTLKQINFVSDKWSLLKSKPSVRPLRLVAPQFAATRCNSWGDAHAVQGGTVPLEENAWIVGSYFGNLDLGCYPSRNPCDTQPGPGQTPLSLPSLNLVRSSQLISNLSIQAVTRGLSRRIPASMCARS